MKPWALFLMCMALAAPVRADDFKAVDPETVLARHQAVVAVEVRPDNTIYRVIVGQDGEWVQMLSETSSYARTGHLTPQQVDVLHALLQAPWTLHSFDTHPLHRPTHRELLVGDHHVDADYDPADVRGAAVPFDALFQQVLGWVPPVSDAEAAQLALMVSAPSLPEVTDLPAVQRPTLPVTLEALSSWVPRNTLAVLVEPGPVHLMPGPPQTDADRLGWFGLETAPPLRQPIDVTASVVAMSQLYRPGAFGSLYTYHGCRLLAVQQTLSNAGDIFDTSHTDFVEVSGHKVFTSAIVSNGDVVTTFTVALPPHLIVCSLDLESLREVLTRMAAGQDAEGLPPLLAALSTHVRSGSAVWGVRSLGTSVQHPIFSAPALGTSRLDGVVVDWARPAVHVTAVGVATDMEKGLEMMPDRYTGLKFVSGGSHVLESDFRPTEHTPHPWQMVLLMLGIPVY